MVFLLLTMNPVLSAFKFEISDCSNRCLFGMENYKFDVFSVLYRYMPLKLFHLQKSFPRLRQMKRLLLMCIL